jgi:hypothetical protein
MCDILLTIISQVLMYYSFRFILDMDGENTCIIKYIKYGGGYQFVNL